MTDFIPLSRCIKPAYLQNHFLKFLMYILSHKTKYKIIYNNIKKIEKYQTYKLKEKGHNLLGN